MKTYNYNEQMSELMDDESLDADILDKLIHDDEMKKTWNRYHIIRDCLRGKLPEDISRDLSSQVSSNLKSDVTFLIPEKKARQFKAKAVVGFAIAASVAVVTVLGFQSNKESFSPAQQAKVSNPALKKQEETPQIFLVDEPDVLPASIKSNEQSGLIIDEYKYDIDNNKDLPNIEKNVIKSQK